MKFKKILPILILSTLSTMFVSSCSSNEIRITFKMVRVIDGQDILEGRNYNFTVLYEKNHVYTEYENKFIAGVMEHYYYSSGAPYSCYEIMDFDDLYLYENNEYSWDKEKKLNVGDIFNKDSTYVCFSYYTPTTSSSNSDSDVSDYC